MGAGFVVLMYLIAIFMVSAAMALVAAVITAIVAKPPKKRKIVAAVLSPFLFFYSWFFLGLFATGALSEWKNVDIGIGDTWHVPINDEYSLLMIDLTEEAYLQRGNTDIMTVKSMQQNDGFLIGQNTDGFYFSLDLKRHKVQLFQTEQDLITASGQAAIALDDVETFYAKRKSEIVGLWNVFISGATFLLSAATTFLFARLVIYGNLRFRRHNH